MSAGDVGGQYADYSFYPRLAPKVLAHDGVLIVYGGGDKTYTNNDIWESRDQGASWKKVNNAIFPSQAPVDFQILFYNGFYMALGGYNLRSGLKSMNDKVYYGKSLTEFVQGPTLPKEWLKPRYSKWYATEQFIYLSNTRNTNDRSTQTYEIKDFEKKTSMDGPRI